MVIETETRWLPRPSTNYPGCYPVGFENMLPKILQTENYVHLFSGMAKSGFRIDINKEVNPDMIADVHDLWEIRDNTFHGAMADPPYTKEFAKTLYGLPYPKWSIWTKEMVRIVRPGSLVAVMNNYVVPKIKGCEYVKIIVLINRIKQYPKIVTVQRKL